MQKLQTSSRIFVAESQVSGAGRGVFASADIAEGETIEQCPVIELSGADATHISESLLATYIFFLGDNNDTPVLALGFGSLYNHSDTPNARYAWRVKQKRIDFIAIKTIRTGEEITVDYSPGRTKSSAPLWFT